MDYDETGRESKLCKCLACGCRRACSCKNDEYTNEHDDHSKKYQLGADHWPPNPCRPWISAWFESIDKIEEHPNRYQNETGRVRSETPDGKIDLHLGDRHVFPTQSTRTQYAGTIQIAPTIHPSPSIIGHPSLKIYRFRLPHYLLGLLDQIVDGCSDHASNLQTGWM